MQKVDQQAEIIFDYMQLHQHVDVADALVAPGYTKHLL